jgi:hypothetical protein
MKVQELKIFGTSQPSKEVAFKAIEVNKIQPVNKLYQIAFHWFESDKSRPPHEIITGKSAIMEALLETGIIPTLGWDLYESSWNIVDYWHADLDPAVGVIICEAADD